MKSTAASEHLASQVTRPSLGSALRSMLPTGVFLVFDGWLGLAAGMIAASITTAALLVLQRRRSAGIGILLPISLGFVVAKAIAGVVTESSEVYFGAGVALSALVAVGIGATAFTKRPAAFYALPLVTPYRHLIARPSRLPESVCTGHRSRCALRTRDHGVGGVASHRLHRVGVRRRTDLDGLAGDGRRHLLRDLLRAFPPRPSTSTPFGHVPMMRRPR